MDELGVDDATETIQRVWRGFLGRRRGARMQLNHERDKMRSKQYKKHTTALKDTNHRISQDQNAKQTARTNVSVEQRPKVYDVDDSTMYDPPDVMVYKAVKRGTNIGSYERKSSNVPKGGRMGYNNEESEDDVLHDSLEGPIRPAEKRNAVPSSPSPVYTVDDSLIHSHLSVIAEEDEMIRDSLSGTGILSHLAPAAQQSHHVHSSPKALLRKSAGKSGAVVADSLDGPQSFRPPPRLERQTSSRTQSSRSASRNTDTVDTEAEEVQTGRRSSEADSIEYGQFIKTDHQYDDVIAGLGDDYNAWDDLDREETELDNVIMEDSLRRSRNFQNDLVLAGMKHANEVNKQPHARSAPRSRGGSRDDGPSGHKEQESTRRDDSAIPRFTSRKSTGHLKAFDSDGSLSQQVDSHGAHTSDLSTPPRGGPTQDKFSPEKPYVPSVRDLLAVSPEPPRRQNNGIASDVPRLNLAREAPPAPKSMLSRLEQAQQMYEANVKKNFPNQPNQPNLKAPSNISVQQPEGYSQHDREYSLSPAPLSSRSTNGAERSPRRVPPVLLPTAAQQQGIRGPSPRLQHFHEAPSPTPSQQSGYGYQHSQAHAPLTQRGSAGVDSYPAQNPHNQGAEYAQQGYAQQGYQQQSHQQQQQGYQQDYEQEVPIPKSIRLAPAPSVIPQPAPSTLQPLAQPVAQPAAQRRPPQFPGQVQNEPPVRSQPAAPKQAAGGYFAAYTDSQQQGRGGGGGGGAPPLQAAPAALAPVVAGRFSNLPSKLIPAAVARAPIKVAPFAAVNKNAANNGRPKDMSQTKLTELQEQKLLEEIEELNRIQLQKLQELAQIEQNEKNAVAAAAAARSNSPRKRAQDPVREKEKRAFKAGAKDVNPTPVLIKLKSKPSAGAARGPGPAGAEEWGEAVQRDQPRASSNVRGGYGQVQAPSPTPIQPLLAPPTGVDIHGGLNPGGFAAGAGYLQVYKKKQEVGQRGNSNPRGRRGNGEDNLSANGDAQSEGRLFNRRQNAGPQYAQAQFEETSSLPAIPSARNVKSSGSARVGGQYQGQGQGRGYYEEEPEVLPNPQFVHPLDGQNRRVLSASRNNTMSAPSRLLDEPQAGGYSSNMNGNGYGRAPDRNALPELVKMSHDYGMPSQLPVPMYNMQKKVAPVKGYSKR